MALSMRSLLHKALWNRNAKRVGHTRIWRGITKSVERHSRKESVIILGIETSCDDTGCGIVDDKGNILGEAKHSQEETHLSYGGIIPVFASGMHEKHITTVCENALRSANLRLRDVDAIAATVKPGLSRSLRVGTEFGKYLSRIGEKPFIPIHHMEAHTLTARMAEKVDFPFLVLLISGGHCLLAVVESVEKYYLLGKALDNAPGELLDKVSRRMKLRNLPEFQNMCGGRAIEVAAQRATRVDEFEFFPIMTNNYDCDFSFSGVSSRCLKLLHAEERRECVTAGMTISKIHNLCASFQFALIKHVCQRTQRAIEFIERASLLPEDKRTLVVSGGVAANNSLAKALGTVCQSFNYKFVRTPPKLCTDNGVMIAWNGIERWKVGKGVLTERNEIESVEVANKAPLGEDWRQRVEDAELKCKWVNVKDAVLS